MSTFSSSCGLVVTNLPRLLAPAGQHSLSMT